MSQSRDGEMADTHASEACAARRGGSTPLPGTLRQAQGACTLNLSKSFEGNLDPDFCIPLARDRVS
jgi:hypothetical protein